MKCRSMTSNPCQKTSPAIRSWMFTGLVFQGLAAAMCLTSLTVTPAWGQEVSAEKQWASWRGPAGNGSSATAKPPVEFSSTENVK